jgi:hypothetical protein
MTEWLLVCLEADSQDAQQVPLVHSQSAHKAGLASR